MCHPSSLQPQQSMHARPICPTKSPHHLPMRAELTETEEYPNERRGPQAKEEDFIPMSHLVVFIAAHLPGLGTDATGLLGRLLAALRRPAAGAPTLRRRGRRCRHRLARRDLCWRLPSRGCLCRGCLGGCRLGCCRCLGGLWGGAAAGGCTSRLLIGCCRLGAGRHAHLLLRLLFFLFVLLFLLLFLLGLFHGVLWRAAPALHKTPSAVPYCTLCACWQADAPWSGQKRSFQVT